MKTLIHIFAIWLIAIILPVQGFAAASMLNCEPPQSQPTHESVSSHHHAHQALVADGHTHQHNDRSKHACKHCAKCSACCSGFTFSASAYGLIHHLDIANASIGFTATDFNSFIPSGPERPPRLTLV